MDIAKLEDKYYIIEFQFISFGNYTLERSKYYYKKTYQNGWMKIEETPDLEREFAASVVQYIERNVMPHRGIPKA